MRPRSIHASTLMGTRRTIPRRTDHTLGSTSSKPTNDGFSRFDEPYRHSLLPGIPDDVTLDLITSKLPWRTFHILSSVSLAWRRAIRSRQIYNARVRAQATEPVVVLIVTTPVINLAKTKFGYHICLYSMRDKSFYLLPQIPNVSFGIPILSKCISMDGKIYVLGGYRDRNIEPGDSLCVTDLAGQRQWEWCKSMRFARESFGVGGIGEKIYVFGGYDRSGHPLCGGEVYDPESNTWNPIRPMMFWKDVWQINHRVTAIGEELFLFDQSTSLHHWRAKFFLAYHPEKEEYRKVKHVQRDLRAGEIECLFTAQGQLHSMTSTGICVYDMERNSWTPRHSFSSPEITHALSYQSVQWTTVAADNELVTLVTWADSHCGQDLLQSVGFGGQRETIVWRKIECSFHIPFLSSISLIRL